MQKNDSFIACEWKRFVLGAKYLIVVLIIACGIMTVYALAVKPIVPSIVTDYVLASAEVVFLIVCFYALHKADKKFPRKERLR